MIILLMALGAGVLVGGATAAFFDPIAAPLPGLVVAVGVYFLLTRRVSKQMEGAMMSIQREIQAGRVDNAINALEMMKAKFQRMQFFAGATLDGQIGSIYFMQKKFDKAKPFLENAFVRMWNAKAMLGVLQSKSKDYEAMDATFERATKYSPKQGVMWCTWAWIHWKAGHKTKAIEILTRGKEALGDGDEALNTNLLQLQNNKKMKMKPYGDQWYQFHLETHPQMKAAQRGRVRFARK
jgi:tetratricopeptide (TPR) repeat protein